MNENFISVLVEEIEKNYPPFLRPADLIRLSLFPSAAAICVAVGKKKAPPHIKMSVRKMMFPRASLCAWLREKAGKQLIAQ